MGDVLTQLETLSRDTGWLWKSRLIEPKQYRADAGSGIPPEADLVTHYLTVGRFRGIPVNATIDLARYARRYAAMIRTEDPLAHFVRVGARTGQCLPALGPTRGTRKARETSIRNRALSASLVDWEYARNKHRDSDLVSIVVHVRNHPLLFRRMVRALLAHTDSSRVEIIIVDDASAKPFARRLWRLQRWNRRITYLRNDRKMGRAVALNRGFAMSRGERVLFLSPTIEVRPNWLPPLLATMDDTRISAVQPLVRRTAGSEVSYELAFAENSRVSFPSCCGTVSSVNSHQGVCLTGAVTGACCLVRARDFANQSGFDATFINEGDDIDLCLRLNREGGRSCAVVETAEVIQHRVRRRSSKASLALDRESLTMRWAPVLTHAGSPK